LLDIWGQSKNHTEHTNMMHIKWSIYSDPKCRAKITRYKSLQASTY